jgi:hypothetical protein
MASATYLETACHKVSTHESNLKGRSNRYVSTKFLPYLTVGSLSLQLVPLVGTPKKDASKHREGDGSSTLGGRCWVLKHNNQPIVGGSNRRDDGEDARPGWSVWGGCFSFFEAAN